MTANLAFLSQSFERLRNTLCGDDFKVDNMQLIDVYRACLQPVQ